jgi:hypothetical protein
MDDVADESYVVRRTTDPGEAQSFVADTYLPNKLVLPPGTRDIEMELRALQVGSLTAGRQGLVASRASALRSPPTSASVFPFAGALSLGRAATIP